MATKINKKCYNYNMNLATWTALGSFGMAIMFVALIISFYIFLVGPDEKGPERDVAPGPAAYQIISISGVPSIILAGVVFGVRKTDESRSAATVLIVTGILLIVGMVVVSTMLVPKIKEQYIEGGINTIPYIFIIAGAGVVGLGGYLFYKNYKKTSSKFV
jgi:drug/metabolite transporter (DMT)-like permease